MRARTRHFEFLALSAQGFKRTEIAELCYASEWTVKSYLDEIRHELGANNLTHAIALAVAAGALFIDDVGVARVDVPLPTSTLVAA